MKKHLKDIDESEATFQPDIANNNIKWQWGHLILLNDFLVFEIINGDNALKQPVTKYFLWGTSPLNFDGNEPSLEEQLKKDRSEAIVLKDSGVVMESFNESIHFATIHMNRHFGQIVMLKSMIHKLK